MFTTATLSAERCVQSKLSATKLSYLWQSTGCDAWWLQPVGRSSVKASTQAVKYQAGLGPPVPQKCPISDGNFIMGGPIWAGRIHDPDAVKDLLKDITVRLHMMKISLVVDF